MGLKNVISKRAMRNDLDNTFYVLIDTWMKVEYALSKHLISEEDAFNRLTFACKEADSKLEQAKEKYNEVFLEFEGRFNRAINEINKFIAKKGLVPNLQV